MLLLSNYDLARDPNTPATALEKLAEDEVFWVRYWVAKNPNTPATALEKLADDDDYSVRYRVARHPNTPERIKNYLIAKNYVKSI